MSSARLNTTDAIFSRENRLPTYSVGSRKTTPTSISHTAATRTIPSNIRLVDTSKYTRLAEGCKDKILRSGINQDLIAAGGKALQRNAEQDNVVLFHTHVAHLTLECLRSIIQSDTHDVKNTWEHPLSLPSIPKPQPDPASANKTSRSATRPAKRRRISSLTSVQVKPGTGKYVEVRPDMIVVLDPKDAKKIDLERGSLLALCICLICLEMKRTGILSSRVDDIKAAAAALSQPGATPNDDILARGSRSNTTEATELNVGSSNLFKQAICYCLTHRIRNAILSEFGVSFFLRFPEMPLNLSINKLWAHGVGDWMEVGILEEDDSGQMLSAYLGANIEALKDLQEIGRVDVGF
ncbi:hypothetical protein BDP55DRAFT_627216 [Colletotrichum godetiae]|uniref:Uncharacterized protein n=1 Tax=Colletotrichum godetiae TaxID=1209918 RepID=A0AAJ0F3I9_9PEZI|nr:uncharacterized protein BDP55DRAFT_627216 [Colletotrichum godetiae]KAK1691573.1 hypothetical protein BDP55DRAFT_627216 [Colletotrichum godetiae]